MLLSLIVTLSGKKAPYQFSPKISINVSVSSQNLLTFRTLLPHWYKKVAFLVKVLIKLRLKLRFKEMLDLPNFVQMTTYTIQFESSEKILLLMSWTKIMTS